MWKAIGQDCVHLRFPKELADVLAKLLSIVFEKLQLSGEVPSSWRKENISPIFEKERKEDLGNYRLVSLTSAWKDHGTNPLEEMLRLMQDEEVI